jgi:uncharacterized protein (DUF433 family)
MTALTDQATERAAADQAFYAALVEHRILARHTPHQQCEQCPPLPAYMTRALATQWPGVVADPTRCDGAPTLVGTRIQTHDIADTVWWRGVPTATTEWDLTRDDVILACWYQAHHGYRRWAQWANTNKTGFWARPFDQVPDPPNHANGLADSQPTAAVSNTPDNQR